MRWRDSAGVVLSRLLSSRLFIVRRKVNALAIRIIFWGLLWLCFIYFYLPSSLKTNLTSDYSEHIC